jgi:DNA polymerase IIIc chi subunit
MFTLASTACRINAHANQLDFKLWYFESFQFALKKTTAEEMTDK